MRTVLSFVFAVLLVATVSQVSFAQDPPEGGPGMGPGPGMQQGAGKEITPEQFNQMKSNMLKMIDERKAMLDQEKACVQAAKNAEELRKCRPERPMMRPRGAGVENSRAVPVKSVLPWNRWKSRSSARTVTLFLNEKPVGLILPAFPFLRHERYDDNDIRPHGFRQPRYN
jgi:hypothetical protein